MMRPLVMDFRTDVQAQNIGNEYSFGPAILVAPVTEQGAAVKRLYLPRAKWYDFWTGEATDGGRYVETSAPIESLPLFVRAGSILPLGPDVEFAAAKAADPMELRVYRGADGDFTLYEDEGDGYAYEKGAHATTAFHWDEAKQVLSIGERQGKFPGMSASRTFHVVFVSKNHGTGGALTGRADKTVTYSGKQLTVVP
ncbi:MAG TPA: DUF5110 domain-containing protein [Candidatus Angelobacter sp.]|jgi:alpha-D-xyloside xylohydrolase